MVAASLVSCVAPSAVSLAMPKSSTLAKSRPAMSMIMTLAGLRSRWTILRACASSSERQICTRISRVRAGDIAPCFFRISSIGLPSIISIAR